MNDGPRESEISALLDIVLERRKEALGVEKLTKRVVTDC